MKRIPLFFLIALAIPSAKAVDKQHTAASGTMRVSNNDRVNEYNRDVEAAIRNSKNRSGFDRLVLYTGYEPIFKKVDKPGDYRAPYGTGDSLLTRMGDFPGKCIPNLTVLSHGWGSSRLSGGRGLPIAENSESGFPVTGFYTNEAARIAEVSQSVSDYMAANEAGLRERFKTVNGREASAADLEKVKANVFKRYNEISKANSATLYDDNEYVDPSTGKKGVTRSLATRIKKGEIKFCDSCMIQLYSCNLEKNFVDQFAQLSGCQIIYGTGKVTGAVSGKSADGSSDVTLTGYKSSDKVEENGKVKYKNLNTRDGNFVRVTPIRGTNTVYEENVGTALVNKSGEAYGWTYKLFK